MLDPSDTVTVNGGQFTVNIKGGMPKIYHPASDADLVERGEEDTTGEEKSDGICHCVADYNVSE